ncbi:MAG TPA: SH3 domain-containing protein [Xanthobacteraceae bacterium]|nr:SH3 domain-containing protein [Xanthobacteraceae bacterium]
MGSTPALAESSVGQSSGLPVPRFVSLKADRVNVRAGPTKDHQVTWIFTRSGLPVEVTAEFDNWRRIRDWEGAEGWVYHTLLSGRRTVMVTAPKGGEKLLALRESAGEHAPVTAQLEPGVLASVKACTGSWCHLTGRGFDGWLPQNRLWGVYPSEKIE